MAARIDGQGRVALELRAPGATQVFIAGDFNGWSTTALPMERVGEGHFVGVTPALVRSRFTQVQVRYKFIVDGHWIPDPSHRMTIAGDSVLTLPALEASAPEVEGSLYTDGIYFSRAMGRALPYVAWLPPGYTRSDRRYPVLYLLHGYRDGGATDWATKGNLCHLLDTLLHLRRIPPMIVIMPEGGDSFYSDHFDESAPWERALVQDLLFHVDGSFRTRASRKGRAISGISMGGFGAIKLALQYPHLFVAVHSHMGFFDVRDGFRPEIFGEGEASAGHRQWNSPRWLIDEQPERAQSLALSFDCGEQDPLFSENLAFQEQLTNLGVRHTFRSTPGYHTWDVVQRCAPAALEDVGRALGTAARARR